MLRITWVVSSSPSGWYVEQKSASPTAEEFGKKKSSADEFASWKANRDIADSRESVEKANSIDVGVVIVPGIQGTLLYRCRDATKRSGCFPIFLSPLRSDTIDEIYDYISDIKTGKTMALTNKLDSVDYPTITCAPKPYSHIGHCNRVPASGPIRALRGSISSIFPSAAIDGIPYDWRRTFSELTSPQSASSVETTFRRVVGSMEKSKKVIIIAHGHGCRVIAHVLNQTSIEMVQQKKRIHALVCAAPSHRDQAASAMSEGRGVLLTSAAHADGDTCTNVREGQGDFSLVHPLLGMTRRRLQNLPVSKGAWGASQNWRLASSNAQRARLANALPSIRELAASNGSFPSLCGLRNVFCIDARASENYAPGCDQMAWANKHVKLSKTEANDMDIFTLVRNVLGSLIQE